MEVLNEGASAICPHSVKIGFSFLHPVEPVRVALRLEHRLRGHIKIMQDVARHGIAPERVIGHSDVAPLRKEDPGERFDWKRLAAAGIGLWASGKAR